MLSVQKGRLNIGLEKPELDHFIDAAFLFYVFVLFTFNYAKLGLEGLYYAAYFIFVGLSSVKVIMRMLLDGKVMISGITMWYLAFSLLSLASALWTDYFRLVLVTCVRRTQIVVLLFCISQTYATKKGIERCLKLISWAASFCVMYIFIKTDVDKWLIGDFGTEVTQQSASYIGMVLTVTVIITLYFAYYEKQRLYYLFAFIQGAAIVLTASRKSILGACIGLVLLVFLKDRSFKLLLRLLTVFTLIAVVFYCVMNIPDLYQLIGRRFESMLGYMKTTAGDYSMYQRKMFIEYARQFFWEHPILGNGADSFTKLIGEEIGRTTYAHNNYYQVLCDYGLVGFALYYSIYVYMLVKLVRLAFTKQIPGAKLMFCIMLVIMFCEYGIVLYYSVYNMVFLAAVFLFICAADNANKNLNLITMPDKA